jgi:riboflavin synthase
MTRLAYMMAGAVALAATLAAGHAEATDQCMECRAIAHFRTCDKPVEGKRVFQGRATRADEFGCSQLLSLDVVGPAEADLPPRIQVAIGPCAIWAGQNGNVIDIAVEEPHSRQNGLYTLACRHW